ncbi:MAG: hypothetical protein ACI837_001765, partial [Crocinitomicaceae bacterium]
PSLKLSPAAEASGELLRRSFGESERTRQRR